MHERHKHNPTERFTNRARLYSQARPDYPLEALAFVGKHCGLSKTSRLCDFGAGTGISSRAFAALGLQVVALEPNEAMLWEATEHPEYKDRIKYLKASAENSGLPGESFDAVVSAQAFHWFDPQKALNEFQRILRKGGWAILLWNERDESDPFTREYGNLLASWPETSGVELNRGQAGQPLLDSSQFTNKEKNCFANSQIMDLDKLIGRALSASYAPAPDSPEAASFAEKLRQLFGEFQQDELVVMKYECSVYTAQKIEPGARTPA